MLLANESGPVTPGAILEALDAAAVLLGPDSRVGFVNQRAAQLVGRERSELIGMTEPDWRELLGTVTRSVPPPTECGQDLDAGERLESLTYPRRTYAVRSAAITTEAGQGKLELLVDVSDLTRWARDVERDRDLHRRERERLEAQLEQIEKYKMELTANVTHDLRTPLASIKASVSGLLAGDIAYDPQTLRETLTLIEQETDRLQRRVQNLLSMSKMESGDALLSRDWVDLTDIVASALESLRSIRADRAVTFDFQPDLPLVEADFDQLLIAVRNLIENAFLYSPDDTPVEVSVAESLGQVRVKVRDFGQGLMPDEFERIFDKFFRGRSARRIPGTGLGLPICRGIAEAHGGRLWAEHAPGGGVAFVISIPVGADQPVVEEAPGLVSEAAAS